MFVNESGEVVDTDLFETYEQALVLKHLPKDATVLELGARYGTVSCVISSVLADPTRHVAVEPDETVIEALMRNKEANNGHFHIYKGVISQHNFIIDKFPCTKCVRYGSCSLLVLACADVRRLFIDAAGILTGIRLVCCQRRLLHSSKSRFRTFRSCSSSNSTV